MGQNCRYHQSRTLTIVRKTDNLIRLRDFEYGCGFENARSVLILEYLIKMTRVAMRRFLLLTFLIHFLCTAVAQERHYNIYNLSADHGLPSNDVTHVFQDSYGYLWIGSYEGIFRWDGYAFKRYRHNEKDSASLSHNIVYSIFEDSQQRLWVGTIEGLDLYDRHTDTFIKCTISETTRRIPVNAITEDSQHR